MSVIRANRTVAVVIAAAVGLVVGYSIVAGYYAKEPTKTTSSETLPDDPASSAVTTTTTTTTTIAAGPVVPDVRGQRLPQAESNLRSAGYLGWQETDESVRKRPILEKNNWIVTLQDPAPGSTSPHDAVIVLQLKKPTDDHVPVHTSSGVVPDVVCAELQAAQDALRAARLFLITSKDGTGHGRLAVIDRNWVVIAQSVRPGTSPGLTTHVELTVVMYGESPGDSGCQT